MRLVDSPNLKGQTLNLIKLLEIHVPYVVNGWHATESRRVSPPFPVGSKLVAGRSICRASIVTDSY